jgi:hypothetical protein
MKIKLDPIKTRKPVAKKPNTVMKDKSKYSRKKKHKERQ